MSSQYEEEHQGQNPEEEEQIIERMKHQPLGMGKGNLVNNGYSYSTIKNFRGKAFAMGSRGRGS